MQTTIRRIGNSAGMTIPAPLLKMLGLSLGDEIEIKKQDNSLVITKSNNKPKYNLKELLAECNLDAPMPDDMQGWDEAQAVGKEAW